MSAPTPDAAAQASLYLDEQKLAFDFVKHLTTLTTGTIVLLSTFAKSIFKKPEWHFLIPVAFALFAVATIALMLAAFGLLYSVRARGSTWNEHLTPTSTLVGMLTFGIGLMALSAFAVRNWA